MASGLLEISEMNDDNDVFVNTVDVQPSLQQVPNSNMACSRRRRLERAMNRTGPPRLEDLHLAKQSIEKTEISGGDFNAASSASLDDSHGSGEFCSHHNEGRHDSSRKNISTQDGNGNDNVNDKNTKNRKSSSSQDVKENGSDRITGSKTENPSSPLSVSSNGLPKHNHNDRSFSHNGDGHSKSVASPTSSSFQEDLGPDLPQCSSTPDRKLGCDYCSRHRVIHVEVLHPYTPPQRIQQSHRAGSVESDLPSRGKSRSLRRSDSGSTCSVNSDISSSAHKKSSESNRHNIRNGVSADKPPPCVHRHSSHLGLNSSDACNAKRSSFGASRSNSHSNVSSVTSNRQVSRCNSYTDVNSKSPRKQPGVTRTGSHSSISSDVGDSAISRRRSGILRSHSHVGNVTVSTSPVPQGNETNRLRDKTRTKNRLSESGPALHSGKQKSRISEQACAENVKINRQLTAESDKSLKRNSSGKLGSELSAGMEGKQRLHSSHPRKVRHGSSNDKEAGEHGSRRTAKSRMRQSTQKSGRKSASVFDMAATDYEMLPHRSLLDLDQALNSVSQNNSLQVCIG